MKSNILVLSHFYLPETGAASIRIQSFVSALKQSNYTVQVVTPHPNYPQGKVYPGYEKLFLKDRETNTIYLPILFTRNKNVIGRLFSYLSYFLSSFFYTTLSKFNPDMVISSSPPIFTALVGLMVAKIRRSKFILDIRDIWPDIGVQLKIIKNPTGLFVLKKIEKFLLLKSDIIIVTTEGDKRNIISKGINQDKIKVIFNGADTSIFKPVDPNIKTDLMRKVGISSNEKIVTYFGSFNLGMNDLEILSEALQKMQHSKDIFHFVTIGEGNLKKEFLENIKGNIDYTDFPSLSTNDVAEIVSVSDLIVIPRKKIDADTGGNVPVKSYESLAAGVPIILSVNKNDESSKIFADKEFVILIRAGEVSELIEALHNSLRMENLKELGKKGREFVIQNFDRKKQSEKLVKIIEELEKS